MCGIKQNFSKLMHSCRKCMCSRLHLMNAECYSDIHAKNHRHRTPEMLERNYQQKVVEGREHVNGVYARDLFRDIPYFDSTLQLPQCSSNVSALIFISILCIVQCTLSIGTQDKLNRKDSLFFVCF